MSQLKHNMPPGGFSMYKLASIETAKAKTQHDKKAYFLLYGLRF